MRSRRLAPVLALALAVPALASCSLLGGGGHLEDALDAMPSGANLVVFVDRSALAERLDIEDADVGDYVEKVRDDAVGGTELAQWLGPMAEKGAFDERDVEWSISGLVDGGRVSVFRVDDDVDLDELGDDLAAAGLSDDKLRDRRHLRGDLADVAATSGLIGDAYPPVFADTIIDEDEQLVVVSLGASGEAVLETLDDDQDSLGDKDTFGDVLDDADDVEYALLDTDPACGRANVPPAALEESGAGELRAPQTSAFLVAGDDADQSAVLQFADDDTAKEDAKARKAYLADGRLLMSAEPVGDRLTADVERDGDVVRMELDMKSPALGRRLAQDRDGFFACPK